MITASIAFNTFFDSPSTQQSFKKDLYDVPDIPEWPENQLLTFEKQMLGFYITGHPLARYSKTLGTYASYNTQELAHLQEGQAISIGGVIGKVKNITTRKNERMAIAGLEDLNGFIEVLIFPRTYSQYIPMITTNSIVFIKGKVSLRDKDPKVIAEEIIPLQEVHRRYTSSININLLTTGLEEDMLLKLKDILKRHPGNVPVFIGLQSPDQQRIQVVVNPEFYGDPCEQLIDEIEAALGEGVVILRK